MIQEPTKEDWQFICHSVQQRFDKLRPKGGEPTQSANAKEEEARIMNFLLKKAFD